jgi:hypothetical protein
VGNTCGAQKEIDYIIQIKRFCDNLIDKRVLMCVDDLFPVIHLQDAEQYADEDLTKAKQERCLYWNCKSIAVYLLDGDLVVRRLHENKDSPDRWWSHKLVTKQCRSTDQSMGCQRHCRVVTIILFPAVLRRATIINN